MHPPGEPVIVFRPDKALSNDEDETYKGNLVNFDELNIWAQGKCVPLVREITFENAEELTEEGLPFLILFHESSDVENVKAFKDIVVNTLLSEKRKFRFPVQFNSIMIITRLGIIFFILVIILLIITVVIIFKRHFIH